MGRLVDPGRLALFVIAKNVAVLGLIWNAKVIATTAKGHIHAVANAVAIVLIRRLPSASAGIIEQGRRGRLWRRNWLGRGRHALADS